MTISAMRDTSPLSDVNVPTMIVFVNGKGLGTLCRRANISYRLVRKPLGVHLTSADQPRLLKMIDERDARLREAEERAERLVKAREDRLSGFRKRFPNASEETVERLGENLAVYDALGGVPLSLLTEEEVSDLGVERNSQHGTLLENGGATVVPLFRASIPRITPPQPRDEEIHLRAIQMGFMPHKALWALNKLVKMVDNPNKWEVYSIKDCLLNFWVEFLIEGRIARHESNKCWECCGSRECWSGHDCHRCNGSGTYSSRVLYEVRYKFPGDDRIYCFHTFTQPPSISDQPGADLPTYGRRFTEEERKSLPFGFHDLHRIVRHEVKLQKKVAEDRERATLRLEWSRWGLPTLLETVSLPRIRECISLINQLTSSSITEEHRHSSREAVSSNMI